MATLQGLSPNELKSFEEMNSTGRSKKKRKTKEEVRDWLRFGDCHASDGSDWRLVVSS